MMRNNSDIDFLYTPTSTPYKHNAAHESAFGFSDCTVLIELEIDVLVVDKEAGKSSICMLLSVVKL